MTQVKMATRKDFVTKLDSLGYRPNEPKYGYYAKQLMVKTFKINETEISSQDDAKLEKFAVGFASKVRLKYVNEFKYDHGRMLDKKEKWFSEILKNPIETPSPPPPPLPKKGRKKKKPRGRPTEDYLKNGRTQQWKKAKANINDYSLEELIHKALLKAKEEGKKDCAFVLDLLKENQEVNASELRSKYENTVEPVIVLTPKECLAVVLQDRMTYRSYIRMRKRQKKCNAKIYVSWHQILVAKKECAPKGVDKTTKVGKVSVSMQNVCDHHISKILNSLEVKK